MPVSKANIYDVIIAGSGPAGASAAFVLAKAGKKVLVLEKETLPRYKTCGGGLTFKGMELIPFDLSKIIEREFDSISINDFEADVSLLTKRDKPVVSMTMRSDLDYHLMKEAEKEGAELRDNYEIKIINYSGDRIEVFNKKEDKYSSKFFIAADGVLSLAAKKYFGEYYGKRIPALEYEIYLDDDILSQFTKIPRFDFGIVPYGYGWVFPKKDHLSIGVLSMKLKNGNLNKYFSKYLGALGINKVNRAERHGFVIPINHRNKFSENRILLAGDAAGFIDPITAEGISFAVLSGRLAAESIIKGNMDPEIISREYNNQVSKKILPEIKAGKFLSKFIYGYRGLRIWIVKLYGKKLSELMTDVVMGNKKYSELLKDPLNYFKLLFKWSLKNKQVQKFSGKVNTFQTSI
ncbi:MAG: geranylgeranyl reductase family protein [Ignavibacteriaceae bacterium]